MSYDPDKDGKRLVVRNGFMAERTIQTGLGDIPIKAPRVNDRRSDESGKRLKAAPELAIANAALGFWAALDSGKVRVQKV